MPNVGRGKQPYTAPSAGSVFKNPDKTKGVFSGKLIEEAGLKGTTIGGAQISEKHGNFIINTGTATASDVIALVRLAQKTVKEKLVRMARSKGINPSTLTRMWIIEKLTTG
mgnify:CR=1 FL=1